MRVAYGCSSGGGVRGVLWRVEGSSTSGGGVSEGLGQFGGFSSALRVGGDLGKGWQSLTNPKP